MTTEETICPEVLCKAAQHSHWRLSEPLNEQLQEKTKLPEESLHKINSTKVHNFLTPVC